MADSVVNLQKEINASVEKKSTQKLLRNIENTGSIRGDLDQAITKNYQSGAIDDIESGHTKGGFLDWQIAHTLSPYSFRMSKAFRTYRECLMDAFSIGKTEKEKTPQIYKQGQLSPDKLIIYYTGESGGGDDPGNGIYGSMDANYLQFSVQDTEIGGNSVINPRWAFGRDDDIVHPLQALHGRPELGGLGRVYYENYQVNQQELNITLGVPEFQSLWRFYDECVDGNLANDVNSGESINIAKMFGAAIGGAVKLVFKMPIAPILFFDWLADILDPQERITRYYDLRPSMAMYYRFVNSLFVQVAVLMGMTPNANILPDSWFPEANTGGVAKSNNGRGQASRVLYEHSMDWNGNWDHYNASQPEWMDRTGPNIYNILRKQDKRRGLGDPDVLEEYMQVTNLKGLDAKNRGGFFDGFSNGAKKTSQGADKFISFRINKNTDATESLTNQTGQSSVANWLNSRAQQGADARFSAGGSFSALTSIPFLGKVIQGIGDILSSARSMIKFADTAAVIMTGSGFVDIPEIWTGSSFTKNYSFNMSFRPPAGDNSTILGDEYLPLCMLLALGCPRTVGLNSFSSPFIMRAYCKGMFALPLGIVESMTITRGASEFGWSLTRLPTVITVSMSIKDLAPVMHLAMADTAAGMRIFGANTSMQEYMHTLAGSGLNERILFSESFARRIALSSQLRRSTYFNPNFLATALGYAGLPRVLGAISSTSLFEG